MSLEKKPRRIDYLAIFMLMAMIIATGCGMMLGATGNTYAEEYEDPFMYAPAVAHQKTPEAPRFVKAVKRAHD